MSVVLDASMTIAWLLESIDASRAVVLRRVVANGASVPSLWRLEVANTLRHAFRHRRCNEDYADQCIKQLGRLQITVDTQTDRHAWGETWQLANQHNLTIYDTAYLKLAIRCG